MDYTSYFILGSFLLGTLILGLWVGKDVKTMKDYVLANRSLSTAVVTISLLATFIASGDFGHPSHIFRLGIADMVIPACFTFSFFIAGFLIVPNMVYFHDCLTTGDLMHKFYGRGGQYFAGIISVIFSIQLVGSQLRAIGEAGKHLLQLPAGQTILVVGVLVVLYTALSGMRGVAYTDVLQFICMIAVLVLTTHTLINRIGGLEALFQQLPAEKLSFNNQATTIWGRLKSGLFWAIFPTYLFSPPIVQRMLMVSDKRQVKWMFLSGGIIYAVIRLMLMLVGLGAIVLFNSAPEYLAEAENTQPTESLFSYIGSILFASNKTLLSFLFVGLLCVMISTMDSFLVVSTFCVSRVYYSCYSKRFISA
jgi:SSS family solute:Na+ symporter